VTLAVSRNPDKPRPKGTLDKWLCKTAELAGLELPKGARWHALRRKFATEMRHMSLKELCLLGGWKDPKTLLECYQHPDEDALRAALLARQPLGIDPLTVPSEASNGQ
jgi:hypothetical protein